MAERVDVLVVGAGPAGSTVARLAAVQGASVLLIEQSPNIGLPVRCAEYIPAQIARHTTVPARCIAQRIHTLHTYLPDGSCTATRAEGYVIDRSLFDKSLALAACRAGARVWTATRATEQTETGALVRRGGETIEIVSQIVVGADGPRSTVGSWIGMVNNDFIDAVQVEVALSAPRESTEVYFDPQYRGGYGWLFPKGDTANVGVGVSRRMGGDPRAALTHLLERLCISRDTVLGHTAGLVPSGGPLAQMAAGQTLLVGDAAGHTHPVTGAGIAAAVIGGAIAGRVAGRAVRDRDLTVLKQYESEWTAFMHGPLCHALSRRHFLDRHWSDDRHTLSETIKTSWIAFRSYGRRR